MLIFSLGLESIGLRQAILSKEHHFYCCCNTYGAPTTLMVMAKLPVSLQGNISFIDRASSIYLG